MIEQLIDMERTRGDPEYSKLAKQIAQINEQLSKQLNQKGMKQLEALTDAYMRQETAVLRDAFTDGFRSAFELMLEFYKDKTS